MAKKKEQNIEVRAVTGIRARNDPKAARRKKRGEMVRMLAGKGDEGTPEQLAKGEFVDRFTHVGDKHAVVKARQEPLDRYRRRGAVKYRLWQAGDKLRKLWEASIANPKLTASYDSDRVQGGGHGVTVPQVIMDAQAAVLRARAGVGTMHWQVLTAVVLMHWEAQRYAEVHLGKKRKGRGQAAEAGMTSLRNALTELAYHFGILERPDGGNAIEVHMQKLFGPLEN